MTEPNSTPLIEVRDLVKHFGSVIALGGVSMKVHAGEVLCLLGDNGAGKSTLIKTLSGVHAPTEGTFHVEGRPVSFQSPRDALDALETIASNLQREPQNPKFRTLRLGNVNVQRRLGSHAARAALAGLGFVKRDDAMTLETVDMRAVDRTLAAVKSAKSTTEEISWEVRDTTMPSPPPKQAWGTQQSPSPKKPPKPRAPLDAERNRVTRPHTSWDDVVGLGQVKTELQQIAREMQGGPRWDDRLILLYGPPGCGKGLLAACLATEWGRGDLVTVHGAELRSEFSRSKSEAKRFYDRARSLAPSPPRASPRPKSSRESGQSPHRGASPPPRRGRGGGRRGGSPL